MTTAALRPGPRSRWAALLLVVPALVLAGCATALRQETGIVVTIESAGLARVDGFTLRTADGRTLAFSTSGMRFTEGFPPQHLSEHRMLAEPVRVTWQERDGVNHVVRLDDAS